MKTINTYSLALLLILLSGSMVYAQSSTLDELKEQFSKGQVFYAAFQFTQHDDFTGETTNQDGLVWVDQIGYRLESDSKILVVDGALSQVYEEAKNRVIISDYNPEEDDFPPSRILSGIDETYSSSEEKLANGNTLITLTTDDEFALYVTVEIELTSGLKPVKITAYDFGDNVAITTFTEGSFQPKTEDTFKLVYPEDAEIVDLRN